MRHSAATFSAVSGIASVPNACSIFGLTNRHPSVVSSSEPARKRGVGLGENERRPRHALDAAGDDDRHLLAARAGGLHGMSRLEPHKRLTVDPGTS